MTREYGKLVRICGDVLVWLFQEKEKAQEENYEKIYEQELVCFAGSSIECNADAYCATNGRGTGKERG